MKARQYLPAQPIAKGQPAAELVFILSKEAVLPGGSPNIRTRDCEEERGRRALQKVSEGTPSEVRLEGELAEIIRGEEELDIEVTHASDVGADLQRVLAYGVGHIVCELYCLGLGDTCLVSTNWSEASSSAEVECGKGICGGVLADVYTSEIQLLQCGRAGNREIHASDGIRESEAKFIQQPRCDRVGVRNEQAAIVDAVHIIRQKWIRIVRSDVFAAEACIRRLFVIERLIHAKIGAICTGRRGLEVLIVVVRLAGDIRQRVVGQQGFGGWVDGGRWDLRIYTQAA